MRAVPGSARVMTADDSRLAARSLFLVVKQSAGFNWRKWRLKMIDQKIDECSRACGLVSLAGIVDKQVGRRTVPFLAEPVSVVRFERTSPDPIPNESICHARRAPTAARYRRRCLKARLDFQRLGVVPLHVPPHAVGIVVLAMNDATVSNEVLQALAASQTVRGTSATRKENDDCS